MTTTGTFVAAFDLGGTRLKAGIVDADSGHVDDVRVVDTPADAQGALAALAAVGREWVAARQVRATALAVPGLVAPPGTIVALPGKLDGIVGMDLAGYLQRSFGVPALVVNDAIAYGVGEARFGAARAHERSLVMTIGTGVGVAVVENGGPLGSGPLGGGLLGGQLPVFESAEGPRDTRGRRGTIEARCAAHAIVAAARARGSDAADVPAIYEAIRRGDGRARTGVDDYRRDLTRALVVLAHAHAPSVIVLGGGPMTPDNPVIDGLDEAVAAELWPGYTVAIARAERGDEAALLGGASLARRMADRSQA